MIRTVTVGKHQWVQGLFVKDLPDGKVVVRVGEREFSGKPIAARLA